jgi:hypothetical protein
MWLLKFLLNQKTKKDKKKKKKKKKERKKEINKEKKKSKFIALLNFKPISIRCSTHDPFWVKAELKRGQGLDEPSSNQNWKLDSISN